MTKNHLFIFCGIIFVSVALIACGNNPDNNNDAFVGNYNMTITTDSLGTDGDWFTREFYEQMTGNTEDPMVGRLSIALNENKEYAVEAVEVSGDVEAVYFATVGKLDAQGNLVLQDCQTTTDAGYVFEFSFAPIKPSNSLSFRCEMHTMLGSLDCGYIMTVSATKN
ncbi:MAG: hypothetical protein Q4D14_03065 [Bacteroidales bacterium]|nr:hypothetical protein [Bacteroidales bacterium]